MGIRHRGLKKFFTDDESSWLPAASVERIRDMFVALEAAANIQQLRSLPGWKLHPLTGNRKGQWAMSVTGNLRMVFEVKNDEISKMTLEDYH
ncbi:MAG: type II toxin-antitoxin system RelE/ParE family toxin [Gammaproteobacteria bacterium]|nr:type II toxin-antitoxin system RelE/ParE family toxin [Gammaproteobacteria bacterium]